MIQALREKRVAEEKVRYLSEHDSLTGLSNRAFFDAPQASRDDLKARAAVALREKRFDMAEQLLQSGDVSARKLVENLRIYQAELEIQNDGISS